MRFSTRRAVVLEEAHNLPPQPHTPHHPALRYQLAKIDRALAIGPRAASDTCVEILNTVSYLMERAMHRDPETVSMLQSNCVTLNDLERFRHWLDGQAEAYANAIN